MEGTKDKRVYELDLHGKKLTKIERLEKVGFSVLINKLIAWFRSDLPFVCSSQL